MAQARQDQAWNHTASILALLATIHRDPRKGRAFTPADFHPHPRKTPQTPADAAVLPGDIRLLKSVFVDSVPQPSLPENRR